MWRCEKFRVQHIGEYDSGCVLGFPGESGNRDFGHRRQGLSNHAEILWRIALPFFRHYFFIAFDKLVAWQMPASGGETSHHRLFNLNNGVWLRFDLSDVLSHKIWVALTSFQEQNPAFELA